MPNNLTNFVPQLWSTNIVANINQINVMLGLCNTDYEGEIREAGDTVWVRTFGNVTVQSYRRGQAISYSDLVPSKESLQVLDTEYFAFDVDDLDKAQNDINALDGYTGRAAVALNNSVEFYLQSFYNLANASNVVDNGGSPYTIDSTNAYAAIVGAQQALDNQNVPQMGRWMILTPAYRAAIAQDAKWFIRATDLGDELVYSGRIGAKASDAPGFVGKAAGFDLYLSTAAPKDATARYCLFGQDKPISYASQIRDMEALRLESTFATAVRGLLLHGATVFAENAKRLGYVRIAPTQ
ncbi:MAG TPA: hypothetical protein VG406_03725 [Isosphaeraceae bacterium]|jgi:hypothetical protein|nr:hypothetical protein [Isosphaeraceae bacterium]